MQYVVDVHWGGGGSRRFAAELGRVSLGVADDCQWVLPERCGLGTTRLELTMDSDGVTVVITRGSSESSFDGSLGQNFVVLWGDEVFAGPLRLAFSARQRGSSSRRLGVLAGGLAIFGSLAGFLSLRPLGSEEAEGEREAPSLFGKVEVCAATTASEGERLASQRVAQAEAKAERYRFDSGDGVEAVGLLDQAIRCLQTSGSLKPTGPLLETRSRLASRIDDDYASARLRLRLALEQERYAEALVEARQLSGLLSAARLPKDTPYLKYLERAVARLERKNEERGK